MDKTFSWSHRDRFQTWEPDVERVPTKARTPYGPKDAPIAPFDMDGLSETLDHLGIHPPEEPARGVAHVPGHDLLASQVISHGMLVGDDGRPTPPRGRSRVPLAVSHFQHDAPTAVGEALVMAPAPASSADSPASRKAPQSASRATTMTEARIARLRAKRAHLQRLGSAAEGSGAASPSSAAELGAKIATTFRDLRSAWMSLPRTADGLVTADSLRRGLLARQGSVLSSQDVDRVVHTVEAAAGVAEPTAPIAYSDFARALARTDATHVSIPGLLARPSVVLHSDPVPPPTSATTVSSEGSGAAVGASAGDDGRVAAGAVARRPAWGEPPAEVSAFTLPDKHTRLLQEVSRRNTRLPTPTPAAAAAAADSGFGSSRRLSFDDVGDDAEIDNHHHVGHGADVSIASSAAAVPAAGVVTDANRSARMRRGGRRGSLPEPLLASALAHSSGGARVDPAHRRQRVLRRKVEERMTELFGSDPSALRKVFLRFVRSSDGSTTVARAAEGLRHLGVRLSDQDVASLVTSVGGGGGGEAPDVASVASMRVDFDSFARALDGSRDATSSIPHPYAVTSGAAPTTTMAAAASSASDGVGIVPESPMAGGATPRGRRGSIGTGFGIPTATGLRSATSAITPSSSSAASAAASGVSAAASNRGYAALPRELRDLCARIANQLYARGETPSQTFLRVDAQRDGLLTHHEVRDGLTRLGVSLNDRETNTLLAALDREKKGVVDYRAFVSTLFPPDIDPFERPHPLPSGAGLQVGYGKRRAGVETRLAYLGVSSPAKVMNKSALDLDHVDEEDLRLLRQSHARGGEGGGVGFSDGAESLAGSLRSDADDDRATDGVGGGGRGGAPLWETLTRAQIDESGVFTTERDRAAAAITAEDLKRRDYHRPAPHLRGAVPRDVYGVPAQFLRSDSSSSSSAAATASGSATPGGLGSSSSSELGFAEQAAALGVSGPETTRELVVRKKENAVLRKVASSVEGKGGVRDVFLRLNNNHDAKVDYAEFRAGLSRLGVHLTAPEFELLTHRMDADRTGTISYDEFARAIKGDDPVPDSSELFIPTRSEYTPHHYRPPAGAPLTAGQGFPRVALDSRGTAMSLTAPDAPAKQAGSLEEARMQLEIVDRMLRKKGSLREAFLRLPRDASGRVATASFREALLAAGVPASERQVRAFLGATPPAAVDYPTFVKLAQPRAYIEPEQFEGRHGSSGGSGSASVTGRGSGRDGGSGGGGGGASGGFSSAEADALVLGDEGLGRYGAPPPPREDRDIDPVHAEYARKSNADPLGLVADLGSPLLLSARVAKSRSVTIATSEGGHEGGGDRAAVGGGGGGGGGGWGATEGEGDRRGEATPGGRRIVRTIQEEAVAEETAGLPVAGRQPLSRSAVRCADPGSARFAHSDGVKAALVDEASVREGVEEQRRATASTSMSLATTAGTERLAPTSEPSTPWRTTTAAATHAVVEAARAAAAAGDSLTAMTPALEAARQRAAAASTYAARNRSRSVEPAARATPAAGVTTQTAAGRSSSVGRRILRDESGQRFGEGTGVASLLSTPSRPTAASSSFSSTTRGSSSSPSAYVTTAMAAQQSVVAATSVAPSSSSSSSSATVVVRTRPSGLESASKVMHLRSPAATGGGGGGWGEGGRVNPAMMPVAGLRSTEAVAHDPMARSDLGRHQVAGRSQFHRESGIFSATEYPSGSPKSVRIGTVHNVKPLGFLG